MIFITAKNIVLNLIALTLCASLAYAQEESFKPSTVATDEPNIADLANGAGGTESGVSCSTSSGPKVSVPGSKPVSCEGHVANFSLAEAKVGQGPATPGRSSAPANPPAAEKADR